MPKRRYVVADRLPAFLRIDRAQEAAEAAREAGTFDERYGPWICMGCGYPHKYGEPCHGEEADD